MQTLDVRPDFSLEELKAAEEARQADLRDDVRGSANLFFWAAGLAALGTGLLPIRINIFFSIGTIDLLGIYARTPGSLFPLAMYLAAWSWTVFACSLGFLGRTGKRWPFLVGAAMYGLDMIALILTFSIWAFGLHAFLVWKWWQAQAAARELELLTSEQVVTSS